MSKKTVTPVIPQGYHSDRYLVWCRWMRIFRKTYVSARSKPEQPLIVT